MRQGAGPASVRAAGARAYSVRTAIDRAEVLIVLLGVQPAIGAVLLVACAATGATPYLGPAWGAPPTRSRSVRPPAGTSAGLRFHRDRRRRQLIHRSTRGCRRRWRAPTPGSCPPGPGTARCSPRLPDRCDQFPLAGLGSAPSGAPAMSMPMSRAWKPSGAAISTTTSMRSSYSSRSARAMMACWT
jgi:hypothetical protein